MHDGKYELKNYCKIVKKEYHLVFKVYFLKMFTVANKKGKVQRDRSKDKQFTSFAGHNNSVG